MALNEIILDHFNEKLDITINKKGDVISIDLSNRDTESSIRELMNKFIEYSGGTGEQDEDEFFSFCYDKIEAAFGKGSLIKVFGTEHPNGNMIMYFIIKLSRILSDFKAKSNEAMYKKLEKEFGEKYIKRAQNKSV